MTLSDTYSLFLAAGEQGGFVMWPILFVSAVIWYAGFDRLYTIWRVSRARRRFLAQVDKGEDARTGEAAYENLRAALPRIKSGGWSLEYHYRELLVGLVPELDRGFAKMTAWIAAAPLLGLLGTVVGMVETFEVINAFGIGNPHLMAQGISKALLTTQAGLTVAFPGLIFRVFLANRKNKLVERLVGDEETVAHKLGLRGARAITGAAHG